MPGWEARSVFFLQFVALHDSLRLFLQEVDGNDERTETPVPGLAVIETVVDLLGDHGKTENPGTQVEVKVANADACLLCVTSDR
jgi:hypothetical protein